MKKIIYFVMHIRTTVIFASFERAKEIMRGFE